MKSHCLYTSLFDEREFATIYLEPNISFKESNNFAYKDSSEISFLLIVLYGSLKISSTTLKQGDSTVQFNLNDVVSSSAGCIFSLITLSIPYLNEVRSLLCYGSNSKWYKKYDAWVSSINIQYDSTNLLLPWEGYNVTSCYREDIVKMHVHNKLINLIFIQGCPNKIAGYIILRISERTVAYPIRGGNCILVYPNVLHSLLPVPDSEESLSFFVFNNTISKYESEETSDFHVIRKTSWDLIDIKHCDNYGYFAVDNTGVY